MTIRGSLSIRELVKTYLPAPNFIIVHYTYIIGLTILGSILIYPVKNVSYINSLLFASGLATQSGLNPVNLNDLRFYQQLVLYLIPFIANPIFINTVVVFVRMHWFKLRFKEVVAEAKMTRKYGRTMSKAQTDDPERGRGVGGRAITVLHPSTDAIIPNRSSDGGALPPYNTPTPPMVPSPLRSRNTSAEREKSSLETQQYLSVPGNTNGTSAQNGTNGSNGTNGIENEKDDTVGSPSQETQNVHFAVRPHPRRETSASADQHISFLGPIRRKKNPTDNDATLRIPSPREYERGGVPTAVDDEIDAISLHQGTNTSPMGEPLRPVVSLPSNGGATNIQGARAATVERSSGLSHMLRHRKPHLPSSATIAAAIHKIKGRRDESPESRMSRARSFVEQEPKPYLSYTPTIGRNSAFVDLTDDQRDELGGIEYRSLKTLSRILLLYFIGWNVFGIVVHLAGIMKDSHYGKILTDQNIGRPWWALFTAMSSFQDVGFTLTPNSMVSFQRSEYFLLFGAFLVIIGNTAFPCLLRFSIWLGFKIAPADSALREDLHFLLDHPRRCFTLLFPSKPSWVLFGILIALNAIDTILFLVLDFNNPEVVNMHNGKRLVAGLYQAAATRTAGFAIVNIAELHPAVQVSYMVMMYISVFPVAISVRRTNVYEERSLGIYSGDIEDEAADPTKEPSYIGAHLRKQLSFDLWYIVLGLFIICIAEGGKLADDSRPGFNIYAILFEVVSAYGTVGLSLGYPGTDTSFCAQFSVVSKLVIIAMQIRGRHRGLPYELDRAILLPSKSLHHKEESFAKRMLQRRMSNMETLLNEGTRERPRLGATTQERRDLLTNPAFENAITIGSTTTGA